MNDDNLYPLELNFKKVSDDAPFVITEQMDAPTDKQTVVEFERHTHSLGVSVQNLIHRTDYKTTEVLTKDYKGTGSFTASTRHRLTGEGILERGNYRPDTISIFGGNNKTSKVGIEIYIRPDDLENDLFSFSAFKEIQSYDISNEEAFFLSLFLSKQRFEEIAELIRSGSINDFYVHFDAGSLKNIFAERSYFAEREDFKFLSNVKDIKNHDAVPENFLKRDDLAEFEMTITKKSSFQKIENTDSTDENSEVDSDLDVEGPSENNMISNSAVGAQQPIKALNDKWLSRLVFSLWAIAIIFLIFK